MSKQQSNQSCRQYRLMKRNRKLHAHIRDVVVASGCATYVGGNAPVEEMAAELGFAAHDLAIADVRTRKIVTLIVVPHGKWSDPLWRCKAIELRRRARKAGHRAVLVPQFVAEREPRLTNSKLVARAAGVRMDATTSMIAISHLLDNGACGLAEVAAQLRHRDPFGAVLNLVTMGLVNIDMARPITPHSTVDLAN
ncbi:hypothetical protein [Devosia sp.]|uniref:hypothetical protein n=1 Tax=Devosia sp. TaxID=1871048 RepID=UPI001AC390D2|nr:hypothetical protein [Devosia sp.]MBN9335196.1 hypothetical protein [Devosia sp.]